MRICFFFKQKTLLLCVALQFCFAPYVFGFVKLYHFSFCIFFYWHSIILSSTLSFIVNSFVFHCVCVTFCFFYLQFCSLLGSHLNYSVFFVMKLQKLVPDSVSVCSILFPFFFQKFSFMSILSNNAIFDNSSRQKKKFLSLTIRRQQQQLRAKKIHVNIIIFVIAKICWIFFFPQAERNPAYFFCESRLLLKYMNTHSIFWYFFFILSQIFFYFINSSYWRKLWIVFFLFIAKRTCFMI